jgi:hypothetical protein
MVIKEGATYEIIRPSGSLSTTGSDSIIAVEKGDIRYNYFYSPSDSTTSSNSSFYNSVLRQNYLKSLVLKYENDKILNFLVLMFLRSFQRHIGYMKRWLK